MSEVMLVRLNYIEAKNVYCERQSLVSQLLLSRLRQRHRTYSQDIWYSGKEDIQIHQS